MTPKKLIYTVMIALLLPFQLLAWGFKGHQMVAKIAMHQLSEETRQKVLQVLGTMTPEQAATWMDEVRSSKDTTYRYTASWHFVNIDSGAGYVAAPKGDVLTGLNGAFTELQHIENLSPERVKFNVLLLFHLCGDLNQPLHVGYGSDKGGNTYQVQYKGKGTNLHHVWDSEIIEGNGIAFSTLIDSTKAPSRKEIKQLRKQRINFTKAMDKSRSYLTNVYAVEGHQVDAAYIQKNKAVVEEQLRSSGNLLAACLEQLFRKVKNVPVASTM